MGLPTTADDYNFEAVGIPCQTPGRSGMKRFLFRCLLFSVALPCAGGGAFAQDGGSQRQVNQAKDDAEYAVILINATLISSSSEVRVTWMDSETPRAEYRIYRSSNQVKAPEALASATMVGVVRAGVQKLVEKPKSDGRFYYAVTTVVAGREYASYVADQSFTVSPVLYLAARGKDEILLAAQGKDYSCAVCSDRNINPNAALTVNVSDVEKKNQIQGLFDRSWYDKVNTHILALTGGRAKLMNVVLAPRENTITICLDDEISGEVFSKFVGTYGEYFLYQAPAARDYFNPILFTISFAEKARPEPFASTFVSAGSQTICVLTSSKRSLSLRLGGPRSDNFLVPRDVLSISASSIGAQDFAEGRALREFVEMPLRRNGKYSEYGNVLKILGIVE